MIVTVGARQVGIDLVVICPAGRAEIDRSKLPAQLLVTLVPSITRLWPAAEVLSFPIWFAS